MLPAGDSRMEWMLRLVGMGIDGQPKKSACHLLRQRQPDLACDLDLNHARKNAYVRGDCGIAISEER